jgi:hypothetical protein
VGRLQGRNRVEDDRVTLGLVEVDDIDVFVSVVDLLQQIVAKLGLLKLRMYFYEYKLLLRALGLHLCVLSVR